MKNFILNIHLLLINFESLAILCTTCKYESPSQIVIVFENNPFWGTGLTNSILIPSLAENKTKGEPGQHSFAFSGALASSVYLIITSSSYNTMYSLVTKKFNDYIKYNIL